MIKHCLSFILAFALLAGCDRNSADASTDADQKPSGGQENTAVPDRDTWQKPQELFVLMDGHLKGRTVAELFAGDGYFTFKMVEAGAHVIAMDEDPANIAGLEARKQELGLTDEQLTIRMVKAGEHGLTAMEADAAVIVHSYGRVKDRRAYFGRLREGLKDPKPVYIVEWQHRQTPVGPPMEQRTPIVTMMDELGDAGFIGVGAISDKMPYQVVILASDPLEGDH